MYYSEMCYQCISYRCCSDNIVQLQIPNACQLSSSWGGDGARPIVTSDQLQYICGPLLNLLAKTLSTVAQSKLEPILEQALHDFIGYINILSD